ncbi:MAG: isopeptide-forming domain-containing fimbrial protein [Lachnospiraceae bacterium]|nr:isopeptide-forming domain-containing fimbrial protein [Lachnospiraceae bacterium]MDY5741945.1 isopeptide-forming domain-containing fimbrial protein [Lachnospiraceae bacterium]
MSSKQNRKKRFRTSVVAMLAAVLCIVGMFSKIPAFANGNANIDLTLTSNSPEIKAGTTGVYELDVKIAGSQESIRERFQGNTTLKVQLPAGEAIELYDLQTPLEDLAIAGIVPEYSEGARTLTYTFPNLETGISGKVSIGITTKNGITPNDTRLSAVAMLISEANLGLAQSEEATVIVKSDYSQSIGKEYLYVEHDHTLNAARPGEAVVWKIKAEVLLPKVGGTYIDPQSEIIIKDILNPRLSYVKSSVVSGPAAKSTVEENGTVTWKFAAPALAEQAGKDQLFTVEIEVVTKTDAAIDKYTKIPNSASIESTSLFGRLYEKQSGAPTAVVVPTGVPLVNGPGNYYPPVVYGALNGAGAIGGSNNINPNPAITDIEKAIFHAEYNIALREDEVLTDANGAPLDKSVWSIEKVLQDGYKKIAIEYTFDNDKLVFGAIRPFTPKAYYHSSLAWTKLVTLPKATVEVTLADGSKKSAVADWSKTQDHVTGYVDVTRQDLGLSDKDKVTSYTITYENEDGSPMFGGANFLTHNMFTVVPGAEGVAKWKPSFVVTMKDGTVMRRTGGATTTATGERTVTIVKKEAETPTVRGMVEFTNKDGNVVKPGDNQVHMIFNDFSTSNAALRKDLSGTILLPVGVTVKGDGAAAFSYMSGRTGVIKKEITGKFEILDKDYQGSGQQLVKGAWNIAQLLPGERLELLFDVTISKNSPDQLPLISYGTSSTDTELKTDANNVTIETDASDIDKNGNSTQKRAKVQAEYVKYSRNDLKIKKYVKGSLDSEYSAFGYTTPGKDISYKLEMTNTTGKDIFQMGFLDVLPGTGDLGIVDGTNRGSAFTPALKGAIRLPKEWENKIDVYYSTVQNPERADLYRTVIYPKDAYIHADPAGVQAPRWTKDTEGWTADDWAKVRSFKLEFKDGIKWVKGQDITLTFDMTAPKETEVDAALLLEGKPNRTEEIETKAAWNSFAVTANGLLPTEPERVGVVLSKEKGEPVEVAYYIRGTSTKLQPNKELVKDRYVGTPYSVPESAKTEPTLLPKELTDEDGKVYELVSTDVKPNGDYPSAKDPNGAKTTVNTSPAEGEVTEEHQVINYDYAPKKGGEVVVKYIIEGTEEVLENPAVQEKDADGNYIVKRPGTQVGTAYDTTDEIFQPKKLTKNGKTYVLTARKVDPKTDPITGKVTEEKQLIIYEYKPVEEETPVDPPKPDPPKSDTDEPAKPNPDEPTKPNPDAPTKPNPDEPTKPGKITKAGGVKTGDPTNAATYAGAMGLAAAAAVAAFKKRKKAR